MDMATRAPMRRIRSSSSSFRHRTSASPSELPLPLEAVDVDAGDDAPLAFARLPLPPLPLLRGGRSASSRAANARDRPTRLPPAPPTIPSEQLFRNRADGSIPRGVRLSCQSAVRGVIVSQKLGHRRRGLIRGHGDESAHASDQVVVVVISAPDVGIPIRAPAPARGCRRRRRGRCPARLRASTLTAPAAPSRWPLCIVQSSQRPGQTHSPPAGTPDDSLGTIVPQPRRRRPVSGPPAARSGRHGRRARAGVSPQREPRQGCRRQDGDGARGPDEVHPHGATDCG